MKMNDYQNLAAETAQYPDAGNGNYNYPALGLCGEAGEVANIVKKIYRDDSAKLTPARKEALIDELGDVLWYVSMLARELGEDLETVAQLNVAKLKERQARGTIRGR